MTRRTGWPITADERSRLSEFWKLSEHERAAVIRCMAREHHVSTISKATGISELALIKIIGENTSAE